MRGILADINVGKHLRLFLAIWATEAWRDLWSVLGLSVPSFPSLGLAYNASDALIWATCLGAVELTENESVDACNQRDRYWLSVVFDCGTAHPRLLRVRDPFGKLVRKAKGGVRIDGTAILEAAEGTER